MSGIANPYPRLTLGSPVFEVSTSTHFLRSDVGHAASGPAPSGGPRTDTGVGIGSSEGQVKAAYGRRVKVSDHVYVQGGHYLEVLAGQGDPAGTAIVFETDQTGRVTAMRWGQRQQAEYIEGCL